MGQISIRTPSRISKASLANIWAVLPATVFLSQSSVTIVIFDLRSFLNNQCGVKLNIKDAINFKPIARDNVIESMIGNCCEKQASLD